MPPPFGDVGRNRCDMFEHGVKNEIVNIKSDHLMGFNRICLAIIYDPTCNRNNSYHSVELRDDSENVVTENKVKEWDH